MHQEKQIGSVVGFNAKAGVDTLFITLSIKKGVRIPRGSSFYIHGIDNGPFASGSDILVDYANSKFNLSKADTIRAFYLPK